MFTQPASLPLRSGTIFGMLLMLFTLLPAQADIVIPGADGSDGALTITTNTTIDLSQAVSANWDTPSPQPGKGVYDGTKWAVVFKYSSVNISSGATLKFTNHASRAPVVWLVNGNVTIAGTLSLDGATSKSPAYDATEPGPGGFRGGLPNLSVNLPAGYGFGPGGPMSTSTGGSYSTKGDGSQPGNTYGNTVIVPLLGGSGGSSSNQPSNSGSGGGAILIATSGQVAISGTVSANGGAIVSYYDGGGSGGAVRVIASSLSGTGTIKAVGSGGGNPAGDGRIRLEASSCTGSLSVTPSTAIEPPPVPVMLWPPDTAPSARIVSVGTQTVPDSPLASLGPSPADIRLYSGAQLAVVIETKNVEAAKAKVTLRVTPKHGAPQMLEASYSSGTTELSLWTVDVSMPQGFCALQARVDPK